MAKSRRLGIWMCTALVVGNMIGSGVFLLPSALAPYGPISIAGWLLTSTGAIVLALVFGRLARLVPKTGGPYAYTREGFGEFAGFLVAWGYWIALWSGNAAVAVAFAGYFGFLVPVVGESGLASLGTALAAIWLLTWVNVRGVQAAGMVQVATTVLKIMPLILIGTLGLAYLDLDHFTPLNVSGKSGGVAIAACAALTLWAFLGLESATVPASDVDRAETTIPRATVLGTCFAAAIYILVTVAAIGILPLSRLEHSTAPLAEAAESVWGNSGAILIAVGACVSTFGTLNGFTLLTGQVPLGAAQDGVFPAHFGKLSTRGTPAFGLIFSNALATLIIAMNYTKGLVELFSFMILLATLTTLVPYAFCALAEIMIYIRNPELPRHGTFGRALALGVLGFVYSTWAIFGAGEEVVFYGFLLLIAGLPVYVWIKHQTSTILGGINAQPRQSIEGQ